MNASTPFALRLAWAQGLFERGHYLAAAPALAALVAFVSDVSDHDRAALQGALDRLIRPGLS